MTVGAVAALLLIATAIPVVAVVHSTQARANAVADLSALAGGDYSATGGTSTGSDLACQHAGDVAQANNAELVKCQVKGNDTLVEIAMPLQVTASGLFALPGEVHAVARAGPDDGEDATFP